MHPSNHSKLPILLSPRGILASHFLNTYPTCPTLSLYLPSSKVEISFNTLKKVVGSVENYFFFFLFQQHRLK